MATTPKKKTDATAQEPLKVWAKRIAAKAPPLSDDRFQQLRTLVVDGPGTREGSKKAA